MFGDAQLTPANTPRVKRNRKFVDSPLEGDGFELPVREHRDSRMCTHFVVNHRVAAHVPVLICRSAPEARTTANWSCCWVRRRRASAMIWALLITGTGSKLRWPSSFRAAAGLPRDGVRGDSG